MNAHIHHQVEYIHQAPSCVSTTTFGSQQTLIYAIAQRVISISITIDLFVAVLWGGCQWIIVRHFFTHSITSAIWKVTYWTFAHAPKTCTQSRKYYVRLSTRMMIKWIGLSLGLYIVRKLSVWPRLVLVYEQRLRFISDCIQPCDFPINPSGTNRRYW